MTTETETKKSRKSLVSPRGVARYPWLNKPDVKFKEGGQYHVELILAEADVKGIEEACTEALQAFVAEDLEGEKDKAKKAQRSKWERHLPIQDELDADGNPTGRKLVKFVSNATRKMKDGSTESRRLAFADARGKPVTNVPPIYGGSELKIAYQPSAGRWDAQKKFGVTLYINAVQILKLAEGNSGVAAFEDEGDGFEATDSAGDASTDNATDSQDGNY